MAYRLFRALPTLNTDFLHVRIGDVCSLTGDFATALKHYSTALALVLP